MSREPVSACCPGAEGGEAARASRPDDRCLAAALRAAAAWADGARPSGLEARSGLARARVRPRRPATSPRVPRSLASPSPLWAWTRSAAHRGRCPATATPPQVAAASWCPGGAPGARPCAVVRRTRRRAGAVCGTAVRAGWGRPPGGVAWPAPPDRRRAGRRRRAVPTGESAPLNQSGRQGRNVDHTTRWAWARTTLGIAYHDAEWGVPVHDDRILYGATKWPRLVARIAEAGSVAGRGCSPSPQDMPDAQHVLVLPVAGWVNRPPDNQIAYLREEQRGLLAWRLGWARRVPVVGRGGTQRWRPTQCAH